LPDDNNYYARTVYKSNSNGVWRAISHYKKGLVFGKGLETEESVTYPHELQRVFEKLSAEEEIKLEKEEGRQLFLGLATWDYKVGTTFIGEAVPKTAIEIGEFKTEEPSSYTFKEGFEPDFSTASILSAPKPYDTYNEIVKRNVKTYIVKSKNGKVSYLFNYDEVDDVVWIGSIQLTERVFNK